MSETKFWLVWSPEGRTAPSKRMVSKEQAFAVAKEMALRHPGQSFYALEALGGAKSEIVAKAIEVVEPKPELTAWRVGDKARLHIPVNSIAHGRLVELRTQRDGFFSGVYLEPRTEHGFTSPAGSFFGGVTAEYLRPA